MVEGECIKPCSAKLEKGSSHLKLLHSLENCFADVFLHFVCKRSVVHSVPFFCTFHFVSG